MDFFAGVSVLPGRPRRNLFYDPRFAAVWPGLPRFAAVCGRRVVSLCGKLVFWQLGQDRSRWDQIGPDPQAASWSYRELSRPEAGAIGTPEEDE